MFKIALLSLLMCTLAHGSHIPNGIKFGELFVPTEELNKLHQNQTSLHGVYLLIQTKPTKESDTQLEFRDAFSGLKVITSRSKKKLISINKEQAQLVYIDLKYQKRMQNILKCFNGGR